jgi:hypothetical protein
LTSGGIGQAVSQTTRRGIFMDIREIQRLHAQFAPDSMVIDLPRQIAALPAPGDPSESDPSRARHARMAGVAPRARQAAIGLGIAAMVAMTGVGAASLYRNFQAGHHSASTVSTAPEQKPDASPQSTEKPAFQEVDATPAHPVSAAPTLSASDFASAGSLGLTADQFRNSLKSPARAGQPVTSPSAPALSSEAQLAAVSPIHRVGASREASAAATQPTPRAEPAPAQAVVVAKPAPAAQSKAQTAQPAQITQPPAAAAQAAAPVAQAAQPAQPVQPAEAVKPARAAHRHISRPRAEQNAESNSDARPSAESRAGSAEVKMF